MLEFELLDEVPEKEGRGKYAELLSMFLESGKPAMAMPCVSVEQAKSVSTTISAYARKHNISVVCWRKNNRVVVVRG